MRTTTFSYNNGGARSITVASQEILGTGAEHIRDAIRDRFYTRLRESAEKNELAHSTVLSDLIAYDFGELAFRLGEPCDTSLTTAERCVDRLLEDRVDGMPYDTQARLLNALYGGKLSVVSDGWDDEGYESITFRDLHMGGTYEYTVKVDDMPARILEAIATNFATSWMDVARFDRDMAERLDTATCHSMDEYRQLIDGECSDWVYGLDLDWLAGLYCAVNGGLRTIVFSFNKWNVI